MTFTLDQLKAAMPNAARVLPALGPCMLQAMDKGAITTPLRAAAFIAQVGHESCDLKYMAEIASGQAYEGRADLGNVHPGDGVAYKGRGPIQITGRYNYTKFAAWSGTDCVTSPKLLESPYLGFLASVWFWTANGLNALADDGDFLKISIRINGRNKQTGLPNGWDDRLARYGAAKRALLPMMA